MYSILVFAAMALPALSCRPSHPRVALQSSLEPHGQCLQPKITPLDVGDDGVYAQQHLDYSLGEPYGNTTCLVSVVNVNAGDTVNMQFLQDKVNIYLKDDVFRREFLQGILFQGAKENEVTFDVDLQQLHRQWGTTWHCFLADSNTNLHPGPYSAVRGELYDVRRIYNDDSLAFVRATWHPRGSEYGLTQIHLAGDRYRSLGIAVPSRLHSLDPSHRLPLDGVRIAVKDNFDIAGLRTSVGSLPYYQLYPPKSQTADAVARLISLGAQVVGKLAMSAFALQEHPMQSVDYQAPINPRADGYQIPGGSSSGGGAAIASYDWLDLALVSDTTGSARIPALLNGCFGLRPTPGLISNAGCKGVYPAFDTPALLGRDLTLFDRFLSAWNTTSRPLITSSTRPRILYPKDFLPTNNQEQLRILDTFAERLSLALGSELEHMSIAEAWAEDSPEGDGNLDTYLFNSFDQFRSLYETENHKTPFVTEVVRWMWDVGSKVYISQYQEVSRRIAVFRTWFINKYMHTDGRPSIFILPISEVAPSYRDVYPGVPKEPSTGLRTTYLSPALGAPELAIPIGQLPYQSRITRKTESLPVLAAIMSPPGSDLDLVRIALEYLEKIPLPTKVHTGKLMFSGNASVSEEPLPL